jgi:hypothetical protein
VTRVFRLPRTTYLVVVFLVFAAFAVAFGTAASGGAHAASPDTGIDVTWRVAVFLVPLLAAVYIARTATIVGADGVRIRAAFGTRALTWDEIRGLSIGGGNVYAVQADGAIRLPCVRVANLAELARASGGRLPAIDDPTPKYAKQARRRR